MPFVSQKDARERVQFQTPFDYQPVPEFSEVFNASLGLVFDEELSISGAFNREGIQERNEKINQLIRSGAESAEPYTGHRNGSFNYAQFAEDKKIPGILTDSELQERRNKVLADRRGYAKDVIERGSGMAQFLGAATGYILDPINISTMGLSGAVVAGKSLSIGGRALMTARNSAAIGAVSELAIQPLVYAHKQDIDSPYAARDAITAIATTALGAGALGGVTGGISGYLKSFRKAVEESADITPEVEAALESVYRMERSLESAPKIDIEAAEKDFIQELKSELIASAGGKLTRGERKSLIAEAQELQRRINRVEEIPEPIVKGKNIPARKAKAESAKAGREAAAEERSLFQEKLSIVTAKLDRDKLSSAAEADLSRLEQGILPEAHQLKLDKLKQSLVVESETKFLQEVEARRIESGRPSKKIDDYADPEQPKAPAAKATPREREILQSNETLENQNRDMAAYANLSDAQKGEVSAMIDKFDEELEGLESVLVCALA